MRNKKNEVKDFSEIVSIISKCDTIRIAMFDEKYPYIIPLNFGEEVIDNQIIFYVHTGYKGKKIDLLKQNSNVAFEMDCNHELYYRESNKSCNFRFQSVVGTAHVEIVTEDMKDKALTILMKHYHSDEIKYNPKFAPATLCLKIIVDTITGKRADPKQHTPDYKIMPFNGDMNNSFI